MDSTCPGGTEQGSLGTWLCRCGRGCAGCALGLGQKEVWAVGERGAGEILGFSLIVFRHTAPA